MWRTIKLWPEDAVRGRQCGRAVADPGFANGGGQGRAPKARGSRRFRRQKPLLVGKLAVVCMQIALGDKTCVFETTL